MGFLRSRDPDLGDRIRAALAAMQGDTSAYARFQQQQQQRAELALRQQAAERAVAERDNQVWGLKESGVSNPLISALSPGDASQIMRERFAPRSGAPGTQFTVPSLNGGQDQVSMVPTMDEQNAAAMNAQQPGMGDAFRRRQAYGPPVAVPEGAGLAENGPQGWGWGIRPASMGPAPATAPSRPGGPPASAPRIGQGPTAYGDPVRELTQLLGVAPSSGFRTQGHQDALVRQGLTRARHSQHTERNALDFPIPAGPQQQAAAAQIRQRYPQARFAFEGTNLHVTLPGWGQAPDISGSARRYPGAQGGNAQAAAVRARAAQAIREGRDPAQVRARLREMGVSDAGL